MKNKTTVSSSKIYRKDGGVRIFLRAPIEAYEYLNGKDGILISKAFPKYRIPKDTWIEIISEPVPARLQDENRSVVRARFVESNVILREMWVDAEIIIASVPYSEYPTLEKK